MGNHLTYDTNFVGQKFFKIRLQSFDVYEKLKKAEKTPNATEIYHLQNSRKILLKNPLQCAPVIVNTPF